MGSTHGSLQTKTMTQVNMDSPEAKIVREAIETNKVVIFSKSYCPFSSMAKDQFRKLSVPIFVIELDGRHDGPEIQNVLEALTGAKTVPRCFIDGHFIGGGTDVKRMFDEGELQKYFA